MDDTLPALANLVIAEASPVAHNTGSRMAGHPPSTAPPLSARCAISAGSDGVAVALLCCLGGRPEEFADALPGHVLRTGVDDLSFAACSCEGRVFEEVFLDGALVARFWFVVLEAGGELVGVVDDDDTGPRSVSKVIRLADADTAPWLTIGRNDRGTVDHVPPLTTTTRNKSDPLTKLLPIAFVATAAL